MGNEEKCARFFYLLSLRKRCLCLRTRLILSLSLSLSEREPEVAKMSDAVDMVSDGMAISSLTRKDEDDNPDCDARKVHFRGSSICTGGHYVECIAYGSTLAELQLLYLFALCSASSAVA